MGRDGFFKLDEEKSFFALFIKFRAVIDALVRSNEYVIEDQFFHFANRIPISFSQFLKEIRDKSRSIYFKMIMNISKPHSGQHRKKYNVSICAIFKNEAPYLAEWIVYHTIVGVEHFYLYNNFSSDNYLEILDPYIRSGLVTLIDWPVHQGQTPAYRHCFNNYSNESQWIGMIDIDEFVTPVKARDIYSVLSKFQNRGAVMFYWKIFTSSGFVHRNINNLVTEDFTVCIGKYYNLGKCFINTAYSPVINKEHYVVHHEAWTTVGKRALPPVNTSDKISYSYKRQCVTEKAFLIQINHYDLKSYDEYVEKVKRGCGFHKRSYKKVARFAVLDRLGDAEDKSAYKYLAELKRQLQRK